jgi:hypothetical protein
MLLGRIRCAIEQRNVVIDLTPCSLVYAQLYTDVSEERATSLMLGKWIWR